MKCFEAVVSRLSDSEREELDTFLAGQLEEVYKMNKCLTKLERLNDAMCVASFIIGLIVGVILTTITVESLRVLCQARLF